MKIPRTVKGKRPDFFDQPGVDYLMSMTMVLAQEMTVLKDRLDLVERVAAAKGVVLREEIENFELDQEALEAREQGRQEFFDRLFVVFAQEVAELQRNDTKEKFQETLDDIAAS